MTATVWAAVDGPGGGVRGGVATGKAGNVEVERSCENREPNRNAAVLDLVIISFSGSVRCTGVGAEGAEGRRMDFSVSGPVAGGPEEGTIGSAGSGRDGKRRGNGLTGVDACAFMGSASSSSVYGLNWL